VVFLYPKRKIKVRKARIMLWLAAVFAFAEKYLDKNGLKKLREVLKMSELATMFIEDGKQEKGIEVARDMLRENMPVDMIARFVRLDESTIIRLKNELDSD